MLVLLTLLLAAEPVAEPIYNGALVNDWRDFGWSPRELGKNAARVNMTKKGGWIISKPKLDKSSFEGLVFEFWAPPAHGDFLEVRLDSPSETLFPRVPLNAAHMRKLDKGSYEVRVPMSELNPNSQSFDRIIFRAYKNVSADFVLFDKIGFYGTVAAPQKSVVAADARDILMSIDCTAPTKPIDPLIYGIAFDPRLDKKEPWQWDVEPTARRWGGNATTRYNWKLGNAWNTANDWFFRNVNHTNDPTYTIEKFIADNNAHNAKSVVALPMIGWVAKDTTSASFPNSKYPGQKFKDPNGHDAGNGLNKDNSPIASPSPEQTSTKASPEFIGEWVKQLQGNTAMYILDNEPDLWSSTHRDIHPEPVTYDELLDRTITYGTAVRKADPKAVIAGPASWGWPGYFFSAADAAAGFGKKPDRKAHGDEPLLAWYLRNLHEHEQKTGVKVLDVLDVHYYPMAKGVGSKKGLTDPETNAMRLRSVRSLWDPTYVDESWIKDVVKLIPRLQQLVAENYPGLQIMIGEWNFGAEDHISGGLATAEALGRFAEGGVKAAFYWTYPPKDSPAAFGFRAFRNYDGKGAHFGNEALSARSQTGASLFASRDDGGEKIVAVAINLDPKAPAAAQIDLGVCGKAVQRKTYTYEAGATQFAAGTQKSGEGMLIKETLPPYSITVFEIQLQQRLQNRVR